VQLRWQVAVERRTHVDSRHVVLHDEENKPRKEKIIISMNDLAFAAWADL
jgi:hypothetical protein